MLPIAILAGGLATRLRPLTETIPKSLLPIAGRPFLFRQLDSLRSQGAEHVVLCVGHLEQPIRDAVGNGEAFGLRVDCTSDGASEVDGCPGVRRVPGGSGAPVRP